jgi:hypothetical protein
MDLMCLWGHAVRRHSLFYIFKRKIIFHLLLVIQIGININI